MKERGRRKEGVGASGRGRRALIELLDTVARQNGSHATASFELYAQQMQVAPRRKTNEGTERNVVGNITTRSSR